MRSADTYFPQRFVFGSFSSTLGLRTGFNGINLISRKQSDQSWGYDRANENYKALLGSRLGTRAAIQVGNLAKVSSHVFLASCE
jgi:hypothetical protein